MDCQRSCSCTWCIWSLFPLAKLCVFDQWRVQRHGNVPMQHWFFISAYKVLYRSKMWTKQRFHLIQSLKCQCREFDFDLEGNKLTNANLQGQLAHNEPTVPSLQILTSSSLAFESAYSTASNFYRINCVDRIWFALIRYVDPSQWSLRMSHLNGKVFRRHDDFICA